MTNNLGEVAFSSFLAEQTRLQEIPNLKFAHYTRAETAMNIIKSNTVWMRNARLMNDYREIQHGEEAVSSHFGYHAECGKKLWKAVNDKFPDLSSEIDKSYTSWASDLKYNSYVTSVSIHKPSEDKTGRLSMWRAYGDKNGVALIFNPKIFFSEDQKLNAFSYPVLYWPEEKISETFADVTDKLCNEISKLDEAGHDDLKYFLEEMFHTYALSLKHPGFAEEEEWRVVYRPNRIPSKVIMSEVASINGAPQLIQKIPLREDLNTSIPQLLDKVIIGPSEHSWEIRDAFLHLLAKAGVEDPTEKVTVSGIPLRH